MMSVLNYLINLNNIFLFINNYATGNAIDHKSINT